MKLAQSFFSKKKLEQSCPFDQKKEKENKERNDRAAVEAVVNQHGFKTFKGCYRELSSSLGDPCRGGTTTNQVVSFLFLFNQCKLRERKKRQKRHTKFGQSLHLTGL